MGSWDLVVRNVHLATLRAGGGPYGAIRDGALAVQGERIAWLGPERELPSTGLGSGTRVVDAGARWATPGLVDCHTHAVFAGHRADEFEERLGGATYEEIARRGGGILSTVRATREASWEELLAAASARVRVLASRGVTTVEVKSGYGLDLATELTMLRVGRSLGGETGVDIQTTFLGAHALPPEWSGDRDGYVRLVCDEMIPAVHEEGLADAVDAFGEGIAFTPEECARVFEAACSRGLAIRMHADQLSDQGGAELAARFGARSADHLEHTSEAGVRAMAQAGAVAVLLPGAAHFLRDATVPPVGRFRAHGVPMAVATDLNPGSSPLLDPLLAGSLACLLFGLTPEEVLRGLTVHAARALGLEADRGVLDVGYRADVALWSVERPAELAYWMGAPPPWAMLRSGVGQGGLAP